MEWTHSDYIECNIGISIGLILIILGLVFGIFYTSNEGQGFVNQRIIGVDPPELEKGVRTKNAEEPLGCSDCKCTRNRWIAFLFCLLGAMTLSITAILLFQGCILSNARVVPDGDCPEFEMDCFIFNDTTSLSSPINQSVSFHCFPNNKTQFLSNSQDVIGWCYGWIIRFQSTKSVLDQLGVCTGLIGLFTTILAIIIYLGKTIKNLVLCSLIILSCLITIILLPVFKWSFAPISFAVLSLGIALGVFGILLYIISPKPKTLTATDEKITPDDTNQLVNKLSQRTEIAQMRSSRVHPK
ncbi:unnamed protein product [Adineta ricciae]|uniref:Uncharacterized protein n=1 Tax=Adineta ricciae TaxID=249248 RepID=A0A816AIP5_ADIRI|nr:unnamed protein product [Adineta ricciae]CAF1598034.1 unnamed protein product [Adineta ricciae]